MPMLSTDEPRTREALDLCVSVLRRLASYQLEPGMERRLAKLSESKEFLGEAEHEELMELVEFTQERTVDKLAALVALKRLGELVPELDNAP